jgi:pantoate--beta-alanine ligase
MSSRNAYLTLEERRAAPVLYRALTAASEAVRAGETDAARLVALVQSLIAAEPLARIDYVDAVDDETLESVTAIEKPAMLALAVWFGKARLIDNLRIVPVGR